MGSKAFGDEFQLIEKYFAPLSKGAPGALGLTDDAALVDIPEGEHLVVAADVLVAGIHFLDDDPAGDIARKIIRVNLSDMAAMGARPLGILLSAVFHDGMSEAWLAQFVGGLKADIEAFEVPLIGGDTVSSPGPLTLSLTALGTVPIDKVLIRGGAVPGDAVYVTGTIGDGALGLAVAQGELTDLPPAHRDFLVQRYRRPEPRLAFGARLVDIGHAAIDVSDGLLADLEHICACSGVGARVTAGNVPLSPATQEALQRRPELLTNVLTGGDDYELLFTASAECEQDLHALASELGMAVTRIGTIMGTPGLEVEDARDLGVSLDSLGFKHFS
jgi:thiamine-monophosphate kinase